MEGTVIFANDHGGVSIRKTLIDTLLATGYKVVDMGVNSETEAVDYPDIAKEACAALLKNNYAFGVLVCGTGIGVSIAANKVRGIRCALPQNAFAAELAKRHNNANVIAFGGRVVYPDPVDKILLAYINAHFEGGRHSLRLEKLTGLESSL